MHGSCIDIHRYRKKSIKYLFPGSSLSFSSPALVPVKFNVPKNEKEGLNGKKK